MHPKIPDLDTDPGVIIKDGGFRAKPPCNPIGGYHRITNLGQRICRKGCPNYIPIHEPFWRRWLRDLWEF